MTTTTEQRGPYPLAVVPPWCRMPPAEHVVLGGCWGISGGKVARGGEDYCRRCEYHDGADRPQAVAVGRGD